MADKPDFSSQEELADLLEGLGLRLHSANRVAGGESGYLWHLAEAIRATGALARRGLDEPELREAFGDGYQAGALSDDGQIEQLLDLLRKQMNRSV